ncbi:hypothetical protein [Cupriavidus plantarum]|uniref:hypothetical protein n=1 Tax=Cupriavidus plantarum TaxID=942865 RepID=UPI0015CAE21F|nr:hypothetical protein [Cupriavidus plantarum]NYI01620.1 ATPase subunit of ABC transporter with duplicated ATPase domains [Cupriavidus plantarum]CAG2148496.1 hypothetical protein LMG26296_04349 [Cupriavidus plantarum]SMR85324.1 hypothetical protein SAMN05421735_4127 [Cupriavidus plantarum]
MSDAKQKARGTLRAEKVATSRALRLSVPQEARPAPVNRKDWLRQRKEQLQAARLAARQRRDLLKAEILSVAQDIAREERAAARLEAERQKAALKSDQTHAREDARAAAKFERGQPARAKADRKTLSNEKRKLVSFADFVRMRR